MIRAAFVISIFFIVGYSPGLNADVGVPVNGFPNWEERVIHVLVNRARCAPAEDLAGCTNCPDAHCYSPVPPLEWIEKLARAARFHAANLTSSGCNLQHNSPCVLVSDIGTLYPDSCDGSASCGCVGGTVECSGTNNSTSWDRLAFFGASSGYRGENIAGTGNPFDIFYSWLWESTNSSSCGFTIENGHRYNILNESFTLLGVGRDGSYTVQDYWGSTTDSHKIPSGCHYPHSGSELIFRANWYDAQPPQKAQVNIDGTLHAMTVERGSGGNATYLLETSVGDDCVQYYFHFSDSAGEMVSYPSSGSFGINCTYDWISSRPTSKPAPAATSSFPLLLLEQ